MITSDKQKAKIEIDRIIDSNNYVEIKMYKSTRTSRQNRALHLFFTNMSDMLNEHGLYFNYSGVITGNIIEIPWTMELFKEMVWKPIQKHLFNKSSTTRLKTNEIDVVFEVINKHFSEKGMEINFPCEFEYYLENSK